MQEQMVVLADLKNGNQEIGFSDSEVTVAEVLPEYAQILCDIYNKHIKEKL
jgi:hypothetical protein